MTKTTATEDKKRKRRIASDEAHAWARNLRLKNPYAKMVLQDLTGFVDGEGFCFVSIPTISEDVELAVETVRKRLAWLEQIGAIARFPQWIDENGRRNGEGRGKRTTDKIRLMTDADDEAIEAAARGEVVFEDADDEQVSSPPRDGGLNAGSDAPAESAAPTPAPQVGLQQPPSCVGGLNPLNLNLEPEPEDSPPSVPHHGGGGGEDLNGGQDREDDPLTGWIKFKQAYEADGDVIVKTSLPMTLFQAVPIAQRPMLIKAARGLIYERKQSKTSRPKPSPQTFIRETESWESWAAKAPPKEGEDFHSVAIDSRDGIAFRMLCKAAGSSEPREYSGFYVIRPRALNAAELAFAEAPHHYDWQLACDAPQVAAWLAFFEKSVQLTARREIVCDHKIGTESKRGIKAPWPWPPSKDGRTIPWPQATGDPKHQSSAA